MPGSASHCGPGDPGKQDERGYPTHVSGFLLLISISVQDSSGIIRK
jgi:hypothetical protein